jgi:DpnII restriction endonuclease
MRAFGRNWTEIDEEAVRDLLSLEREGAIYTDLWQDHLDDFRHVQIKFTPEEIEEYVRSYWAYELFLRAGSPDRAATVPKIPPDIGARADSYQLRTIHGESMGPPYHCPAAFLGEHLEALVCSNKRSVILHEAGKQSLLSTVTRAIDSLTPSIRLFSRREKSLQNWPITCEDDIRDLMYAILRASISDIRREEPVPSKAGTHKFVDLCSKIARLFIEVKWISKSGTWKQIVKQINDDIQSYGMHPACETLVFIVIDTVKDITDPASFERDLMALQTIGNKKIDIYAFVRET